MRTTARLEGDHYILMVQKSSLQTAELQIFMLYLH